MSFQPEQNIPQQFNIILEIVLEDPHDTDLALISAIGRDTIDALQNNDFTVQPMYTGLRSGDFLVQVITTLTSAAIFTWTHKDIVEEVVSDLSALVTIFGSGLIPIAVSMMHAHEKRASKDNRNTSLQPIKITVEIEGAPIIVEASDLEQAEAALTLARRFQNSHPNIAAKLTPQSNVKIKGSISKKPPHQRRK